MTKLTIFHGYTAEGRLVHNTLPALLVEKYSYETDRTELEEIYRDNQAVDGHEQNVIHKARSLSVGDVVEAGGEYTLCANLGWQELGTTLPGVVVTQEKIDELRSPKRNSPLPKILSPYQH